jgi:hypothetical protein
MLRAAIMQRLLTVPGATPEDESDMRFPEDVAAGLFLDDDGAARLALQTGFNLAVELCADVLTNPLSLASRETEEIVAKHLAEFKPEYRRRRSVRAVA